MSRGPLWTEDEIDRAFSLQARGMSYRQIAETLGRSHGAVANKLSECRGPCEYSDKAIRDASARFSADIARLGA